MGVIGTLLLIEVYERVVIFDGLVFGPVSNAFCSSIKPSTYFPTLP